MSAAVRLRTRRRGRVCGARKSTRWGGGLRVEKRGVVELGGVMRQLLITARDFHLLGFGIEGWFRVRNGQRVLDCKTRFLLLIPRHRRRLCIHL